MNQKIYLLALLITVLSGTHIVSFAQPTWTIDLLGKEKKPEKFTERKLGSEKMADKKFTLIRHFFQNNYTRYNYYFNANNKINTVLERAKASQQDDYSKLLAYYPYSLENTASQKTELDSVIYKATAGLLLHDLRNDWVDNMYLLMGKAYFLRKDFDSAAATFQFINFNLFPRKKKEEDSRVIGTSESASNSKISIANTEKQNILQKLTAKPPSRNDALIWLTRTLVEQDELGEAAGLISTLQNDPNLPQRLKNDLDEVNGYWFFKQNNYDSAAVYLEKALTNTENKQDLSRAEFVLAQLYEKMGNFDKATVYYNKASGHTTNALMDIYAQLNNAKMRKGDNVKELDNGITNLLRLSKRDKFETYRDIIFYAAGELAMNKPDTSLAISFFTKSYRLNENSVSYKNKAFLQLGDIAYSRKEYKDAYSFYDSLQSGDTTLADRLETIQARRNSLSKIVEKIFVIEKQDSLQRIAAMEPALRDAFIKKLSKRLRKERGLKEEDNSSSGTNELISFDSKNNEPADLFASSTSSKSGDWYFYNNSVKAKGFNEFKRKWGTRTNIDNWRRKSAAAIAKSDNNDAASPALNMNPDDLDAASMDAINKLDENVDKAKKTGGAGTEEISQPDDITYEGLMSNLPLTEERLDESNNLFAVNLFELAKLYQDELEDYNIAIATYDSALARYPDSLYNGRIYFGLFYCYSKLGDNSSAAYYKKLLDTKFPGTQFAKILSNPAAAKPEQKNEAGTKRYEGIYTRFIEGKFDEAVAEKKKADSLYGNSYWSPQLLYIEAVYHVKQKNDSSAIEVLNNIVSLYPKSPLKPKAEKMIDVLGRRKEIEEYLTKLEVKRYAEDEIVITQQRVPMVRNDSTLIVSPKFNDSSRTAAVLKPAVSNVPVIKDSVLRVPKTASGPYVFNYTAAHNVIMVLDKVDPTYVNESKNAFARFASDNFRALQLSITKDTLNKDLSLVVFSSFETAEEALKFYTRVKKAAPDEVSWLPANKYYFLLIDNDNLERMKQTKDMEGYRKLLKKQFPDFF